MAASNAWGRVADDGTVYVRTAEGERPVGSWQAGPPEQGLAHFVRRYDDLAIEVDLLAQRIASGRADPQQCLETVTALRASLPEAHVVGDLAALDAILQGVHTQATAAVAQARAERAERARQAQAVKEALVAEAEQIAESSTAWKAGGDRLRDILTGWRDVKGGDRKTDAQLGKRLTTARDTFARRRGSHFVQLDQQRKEAVAVKEELVATAEGLATSTDWGPTAARMKSLAAQWKAAPRASREAESALWTRFRAAQDAFFTARSAVLAERDAGLRAIAQAKVAVIEEAEGLDPSRPGPAQARLRTLRERYEATGQVSREAAGRLDARMRAAEQRVRDAAEQRVRDAADGRRQVSSAAANPLLDQIREQVAKTERQLARAREAGEQARIAEYESALASRREFLAQAERSTS